MKKIHFDFEYVIDTIIEKIAIYKYEFGSSVIFGLLSYLYYFTNLVYNHDSMCVIGGQKTVYQLGRWGTHIFQKLLPHPTMPWFGGFGSLILYTIGICLISNIFEIKNKYVKILLAGIIISSPSIMNNYLYMFQAIYYSLAFLLATVTIYLWKNLSSSFYTILSVICIIFLAALYQGSLTIVSSLIIIYLLKLIIINNENYDKVIKKGFVGLGLLVTGTTFYLLTNILIFFFLDSGFNEYANSRLGDLPPISERIILIYKNFCNDLFMGGHGLITSMISRYLHILLTALCIFLVLSQMSKRNKWQNILTISLLFIILPLSINLMYLAVNADGIHILVLFGYISCYVLIAIIIDSYNKRLLIKNILEVSLCVVIFFNVRKANVVAMNTIYLYENAFSFYTTLVTQIKSSGLLDDNSKLAICGSTNRFLYNYRDFPVEYALMGGGVNNYSKQYFIRYHLGFDIPKIDEDEENSIIATEAFKAMPIYPDSGSIKKIGNVIVVKMENE